MGVPWLNIVMFAVDAVRKVESSVKDKGKSKLEKASEITDAGILAAIGMGIDKGILSLPEVQEAKVKLLEAIVAFENVVAAAKEKKNA